MRRAERDDAVLDGSTVDFLGTGCALIVGTATPDGTPRATRGWGISVVDPSRAEVRLLLDADDTATVRELTPGARVAVTAADVRTLRALQMKGRSAGIAPITSEDVARSESYREQYFTDVHETDGVERSMLDRLVPAALVACRVEVDELFDQTPGPGAGSPLVQRS